MGLAGGLASLPLIVPVRVILTNETALADEEFFLMAASHYCIASAAARSGGSNDCDKMTEDNVMTRSKCNNDSGQLQHGRSRGSWKMYIAAASRGRAMI